MLSFSWVNSTVRAANLKGELEQADADALVYPDETAFALSSAFEGVYAAVKVGVSKYGLSNRLPVLRSVATTSATHWQVVPDTAALPAGNCILILRTHDTRTQLQARRPHLLPGHLFNATTRTLLWLHRKKLATHSGLALLEMGIR